MKTQQRACFGRNAWSRINRLIHKPMVLNALRDKLYEYCIIRRNLNIKIENSKFIIYRIQEVIFDSEVKERGEGRVGRRDGVKKSREEVGGESMMRGGGIKRWLEMMSILEI